MLLILLWAAVILAALVLFYRQTYSEFKDHGIKHFRPIPILGNMAKLTLRQDHFVDHLYRLYNAFPEERFVGRYEFMNSMVVIRDIELIKQIGIKDFENFLDHRTPIDEKSDPLFGRNLFAMKGQTWKDMRSTLSPAFTSSKIRLMLPFMVEVGEQMIKALKMKIEESGVGYIDVDCKDLTTRYANDVIASCAFGLKVDSYSNENNNFYAMGKTASTFNFRQLLLFFGFAAFPNIMKVLKLSLFSGESKRFFRELVGSTMKDRELRNIFRPDMIQLLMEAKKGKISHEEKSSKDVDAGFATVEESDVGKKEINRVWSDDDLVAQGVLFFIAGFETVSAAMSFMMHELAQNLDVQERLVQEIKENETKNNGKFDYNSVQNMVYMDMVVSEVLRKWSPGFILDRVAVNSYNLGKPNSKAKEDFILRPNSNIGIPVWAIHHDPQYFPDPEKFDPERFSDKNKHNIKPFTYLPFGIGPRNCIGSRFALCEVKVMAYQLLQHMHVSTCPKTNTTGKLSTETFNVKLDGGHWIRLSVRN